MTQLKIYHKDGTPLKDTNGKIVTVHSLEYNGEWMGQCNLSLNFENESPIVFSIGDYVEYRDERFEVNYDPGKIKSAPLNAKGDGFKYTGVVFNSYTDELARADFRDIVLNDNNIHYTGLPKFAFYVSSLDDVADRLQANMNDLYGVDCWHFYTRNKAKSIKDRKCDEAEWKKIYGDGVSDNTIESTSLSVSSQTCWDVLSLINSKFDVNFIIRGRNVFIGTSGIEASHIFRYGKGNGLYEIEETSDSNQSVITRIRAYGNTTNMPTRYYAEVGAKCFANVLSLTKGSDTLLYCDVELDMSFNPSAFVEYRKYVVPGSGQTEPMVDTSTYVVKVTFDDITIVTGFISGKIGEQKSRFYTEKYSGSYDTGDEKSEENLRTFISQAKEGKPLYIVSGAKRAKMPSKNIKYTSKLPNNMAIDRLMLPGFPNESLKDWWAKQSKEKKAWLNPTGADLRFSQDQYSPYVESPNADKIGIRPTSVFFDSDDDKEGLKDIYPTIEEMRINTVRIDEIDTGTEGVITDDGVFKDGETIPNVDIYLKKEIDFDISTLANEDFQINMKDGMCGGRSFKIAAKTQEKDGRWKLRIERTKDSGLDLFFPYKDFPIKKGDHFVLSGLDMPESYVSSSSEELLRYTIAKLLDNDYTRKVYTPKIDEIFMARQNDAAEADVSGVTKSLYKTIKEGDLVHFKDEDLGIDKTATIEKLSIKENNGNIPTYDIVIREDKEVGTIKKLQNQVSSIVNNTTVPGGYTNTQIKDMVITAAKDYFLSKQSSDTARGLITFLKGLNIGGDRYGIDKEGDAMLRSIMTDMMSKFSGGAQFGEYIQGILYGTGGRVDERGNAEFESITSRSSIIAKELIVNRQQAVESDFMFTESGSVESVVEVPPATEGDNVTYDLKLKKRWDNDFTAFHEQDCVRGSINTLMEDGKYYDMWFRVLNVNTVTNTISVVMYPDDEVPSGKNHPPTELARLIRWGNPVDEKRQSCWYISSENGLLVWLDHVTKPIIDKTNYSVAIGKLPDALSFVFQDFPEANKRDGAFYAKWLAVQNIINVDYEGNIQQNIIDRGLWSLETAQGSKPYRATSTEVHDVWNNGCKWRCIEDKTTSEPKYASTGWAFLEGNPEFTCRITGADGVFDADMISTRDDNGNYPVFTTLSVNGYLYNEDVTENILAKNITWTRDTGNVNEDNIWAVAHANNGFSVPLTWEDLGKNAEERLSCSFKVEVAIIDETVNAQSGETKVIKKATDETII